ncbi:hypothetical protein [Ktedonobacter sp. SOSP1-52]|uniref:hypothetical protein n=1 Tax=Ktedonobacter sp. SOSP1-52 TaxID=2778366 RepID=UPI0019154AC8|nr:hypothetical protein [Ktedonobacter sp. SOSP1-52]
MKDRLNCLLICGRRELRRASRSNVRNLSRYMAELEELIESYRTFATTLTLSTSVERATRRKLVARKPSGSASPATDARKARKELLAWTRRKQTILSLPPIRVARIPTMSCGVVSTRTEPSESSHPLAHGWEERMGGVSSIH